MESFFEGLLFFRAGDREEYIVSSDLDDVGHVILRYGILTVEAGSRGNLRTIAVVHPEGCGSEFTSDMQRYENLQMAAQALNASYSAAHAEPASAGSAGTGSVDGTTEPTHVGTHSNTDVDTAPATEASVVVVPSIAPVVESVAVAPIMSAPSVEPVPEQAPAAHVPEDEPAPKVAKGRSSKGKRGGAKPAPKPVSDSEDDGVLAVVEAIMQPAPSR